MLIIILINCVGIFLEMILYDQDILKFLNLLDDIILVFYILECGIKIIGIGIEKYFLDGWNRFDFFMVLLSLFSGFLYEIF